VDLIVGEHPGQDLCVVLPSLLLYVIVKVAEERIVSINNHTRYDSNSTFVVGNEELYMKD